MTQVLDADKKGLVFKIVNFKIAEENVDRKHVVYSLEIRYISGTDDLSPSVIDRRYTDFCNLYNALKDSTLMSAVTFPKKVLTGNFDTNLIGARSACFETLLKHICSESKLRNSPALARFLQEPELSYIKSLLSQNEYEFAYPLLEQSFRLLNKVYTNRAPVVLLALCRLLACSVLLPGMPGASQWSDLTLYRFDGVRCQRRRCKRRIKKIDFHVVHLNTTKNYLMKQAPSDIWTRWSKWTECSSQCRTTRMRRCKKPGRCKKHAQKETAYCYHERTKCEIYVLNLLETKISKNPLDNRRYEYTYDRQQYITREPKNRQPKCGISFSKPHMLKIIGGSESQKYKWPWHVAVLNQYAEVFCGGTLIATRWVLTASHCIRKYLRVRLNAYDLHSHDGSDIEMVVHKMFPHPKFDYKTVDNDIALLMLPRNVRTPIACLPNRKPKAGQLCSVMGWGKIHTSDTYGVSVLHEAKLPVVSHKTCRRSYREFLISSNMLCAGWKSGKSDTCAGDSGGGLMCPNRKSRKQIFSVQGITSFGDGCGEKNKFGIYTAVFNYVKWINYVIEHYS